MLDLRFYPMEDYEDRHADFLNYMHNDLRVFDRSFSCFEFCEWMRDVFSYDVFLDNERVGFLVMEYVPDFPAWYMTEVCVFKEYRGRGIGKGIFDFVERQTRGKEDLFWFTLPTNQKATELWKKLAEEKGLIRDDSVCFPKDYDDVLHHYYRHKT